MCFIFFMLFFFFCALYFFYPFFFSFFFPNMGVGGGEHMTYCSFHFGWQNEHHSLEKSEYRASQGSMVLYLIRRILTNKTTTTTREERKIHQVFLLLYVWKRRLKNDTSNKSFFLSLGPPPLVWNKNRLCT